MEGPHYGFPRARLAVYDPGNVRVSQEKNMSLMYIVPDLRQTHRRLLSETPGIRIPSPPKRRPWGACSLWPLDPDGNMVSLIERSVNADEQV